VVTGSRSVSFSAFSVVVALLGLAQEIRPPQGPDTPDETIGLACRRTGSRRSWAIERWKRSGA